ncbi:large ribosomal subunit protein bL28 [Devriesea agamarum]|uniref:large ribosomal subunit protein bL28 n=1 Tax=Devriesea agamarum TaxID=472569 RepID=UPI000A001089
MSKVCCKCDRSPGFGNSVSRLGKNAQNRRVLGRSKRRFLPNLQKVTLNSGSNAERVWMCTRCIKRGAKVS